MNVRKLTMTTGYLNLSSHEQIEWLFGKIDRQPIRVEPDHNSWTFYRQKIPRLII